MAIDDNSELPRLQDRGTAGVALLPRYVPGLDVCCGFRAGRRWVRCEPVAARSRRSWLSWIYDRLSQRIAA